MIPVVTLNNKGQVVGQQAFNDNLTPQEEINRIMLATYYHTQLALTNETTGVSVIIGKGEYTDAQLAAIKTAAQTMYTTVMGAVDTFKAAVEANQ